MHFNICCFTIVNNGLHTNLRIVSIKLKAWNKKWMTERKETAQESLFSNTKRVWILWKGYTRVHAYVYFSVIVSVPIEGQHNLPPAVSKCPGKPPGETLKCGLFRSAPQSPQWLFLKDEPSTLTVSLMHFKRWEKPSEHAGDFFDPGSRANHPNPLLHWSSSNCSSISFKLCLAIVLE